MKILARNILLSDQRKFRVTRHLTFWFARLLFLLFVAAVGKIIIPPTGFVITSEILRVVIAIQFAKLILEIVFAYTGIYLLLPRFLMREKYFWFSLGLIFNSVVHIFLLQSFLKWILPLHIYEAMSFSVITEFIMIGAFPVFIVILTYKILKTWYQKEEERTDLIISNSRAELMLLKAHVHPHFLFNTLNNIYSYALDRSSKAAELVSKLSHIIRYMTMECDQSRVSLAKELKMLNDYVGLEKVRYGKRLNLSVDIQGDASEKFIAPLLMIPLIENSFKHGASRMLSHPWISLSIIIEESRLQFNLSNSRPMQQPVANGKSGLGLKNVKRRLDLLYGKNYYLEISSDAEVFSVKMELSLERSSEVTATNEREFNLLNTPQTYASV